MIFSVYLHTVKDILDRYQPNFPAKPNIRCRLPPRKQTRGRTGRRTEHDVRDVNKLSDLKKKRRHIQEDFM